ncbi:DUF6397 family protein [Streptomyces sp. NPDC016309]|uniref:DUF6397 family protein n=1 Tax=Streptomyces sp. NPDC016309 TaxID=3364965 RepID=UPI0037004B3B
MTVKETVTAHTLACGRAARQLELKRNEFELAVQLGHVRTTPGADGGRRRVAAAEIERLRAAPDFPSGLRERVRTVGTSEGAGLAAITNERFTKLARSGHLSPVAFYLNRYRAVVWLYVAAEVREFAERHPELLTGRLPAAVRAGLDAGQDTRSRNWRARRLGLLLRQADDPWTAAAAIASLLPPAHLAEVVGDPRERAHLDRLRPDPPNARPESLAARDIVDGILVADDPDEILWHRTSLALALDEARAARPAPGPDGPDQHTVPKGRYGRSGLLTRIRLGRRRPVGTGRVRAARQGVSVSP